MAPKLLPSELLFETALFLTVDDHVPNAFASGRMLHDFMLPRVVKWAEKMQEQLNKLTQEIKELNQEIKELKWQNEFQKGTIQRQEETIQRQDREIQKLKKANKNLIKLLVQQDKKIEYMRSLIEKKDRTSRLAFGVVCSIRNEFRKEENRSRDILDFTAICSSLDTLHAMLKPPLVLTLSSDMPPSTIEPSALVRSRSEASLSPLSDDDDDSEDDDYSSFGEYLNYMKPQKKKDSKKKGGLFTLLKKVFTNKEKKNTGDTAADGKKKCETIAGPSNVAAASTTSRFAKSCPVGSFQRKLSEKEIGASQHIRPRPSQFRPPGEFPPSSSGSS